MKNQRNVLLALAVFTIAMIWIWHGLLVSARTTSEVDVWHEQQAAAVTAATPIPVTNTAVSGAGSLQQAILDANGNAGADTINFNIPASDPNCNATTHVCTIKPTVDFPLPPITDRVTIDGYSQPGASVNTLANGDDAVLLIEIDGSLHTNSNIGFLLQGAAAGQSVIRGLVIDNWGRGILTQTDSTAVEGCFIGIDPSGTVARPNDIGVFADSFSPTAGMRIGGTSPDLRNVISGNNTAILFQSGPNQVVQGNFIGTNRNGTAAVANGTGITVQASDDALIGGTTEKARNIIAGGPGARGIVITMANRARIQGNFIGTDVTGTVALGGGNLGIDVDFAAADTQIGGLTSTPGTPPGNVISGYGNGTGIQIGVGINNVSNTTVKGNLIGTDAGGTNALGNLTGVAFGDTSNSVGGTDPMDRNVIAFNGSRGVLVSTTGSAVLGNSIHSNGSLGIDLGGDGVSQNDNCDGDGGANNLQNYPVITSVLAAQGLVSISGTLNSTASTTFRLEFFSSTLGDPSGSGEGKTLLGSTNVTTDGTCNASFSSLIFNLPNGEGFITATATKLDGSLNPIETSEFSAFFLAPTAAPASVSGRVKTASGVGVRGIAVQIVDRSTGEVRLTLTNSFGFYTFSDLDTGDFYQVSVASKKYQFAQAVKSFSLTADMTDVNFTAIR